MPEPTILDDPDRLLDPETGDLLNVPRPGDQIALDGDTAPETGDTEVPAADSLAALAAPAQITNRDGATQPQHVERLLRWSDPTKTINICDEILDTFDDGQSKLAEIGMTCVRQYEIDQGSRSEWLSRTKKAMDLAMQVTSPKMFPWPESSNVIYPLIASAAVQFHARAYPSIIPGPDVVKGVVVGTDEGTPVIDPNTGEPAVHPVTGEPMWQVKPGAKQARADRIGQHMSWQLLEEMDEWEEETDKLLLILPIVGCAFRKSLFDSEMQRNASLLVLAQHCVVNYRAKSLKTAPRVTEEFQLYPIEIEEAQLTGTFLTHDYGIAESGGDDEDAPHEFLEQHRRWDLDGDGYAEPYIMTIHKETQHVARIIARYDPEGIRMRGVQKEVIKVEPVEYFTKYDFLPNPDGGIYGVGFGQLLNPINESINTTLNQMFDAGTLQNMGGGFISKGLSMRGGAVKFERGEYKTVNVPGGNIRDAIVPLQFPGPSAVLFNLLGFMVDMGKELAGNTEILSGQQSQANVPATTTLALIEQGLMVFTAVYKRIYRSLKSELDKQKRLNRLYLDTQSMYRYRDEWRVIEQADYAQGGGVEPVADKSMVSDLQQLARAEVLKQFAGDPFIDGREVRRRILVAAKIQDVDKLLLRQVPPDPKVEFAKIKATLDAITSRADALNSVAQSVKYLAEADAKVNEDFRAWADQQWQMILTQFQLLSQDEGGTNGGAGGNGGPGGGGPGQGSGRGGVPALARPSGDASVSDVPA